MPRIFDNIDQQLLPVLRETLAVSKRADFSVGYFNLRGWKAIGDRIDELPPADESPCRLLVGMSRSPAEELRQAIRVDPDGGLDLQTATRLRRQLATEFRDQLTIGAPTDADERALQTLARQLREKRVTVKLFLRHPLHAKLYLLHRDDRVNPMIGFVGSSNLTFSGLEKQGELNVDVFDHDACTKLAAWFDARWNDRWCLDITEDLIQVIEESWARPDLVPPYHIYLKLAYHLSQEAREGLAGFNVPRDIDNELFEYQKAAVKIAAHHLNKRGGVLIGDVVGLGKTLMATAIARIFDDDFGLDTLIICPKNLVPMWEDYRERYRLRARVLSITRVRTELPGLRRYRLVVIDESHNLRNREGSHFKTIQEYVRENESKCILLSATPYNKSYMDLSSQLRLFLPEVDDLGIRPEAFIRALGGEPEFAQRYQVPVRSLAAFERSEYADDWRDLMRLFLVRRTRSFIQQNYARTDEQGRNYLPLGDGGRSYFPRRIPRTIKFDTKHENPYARLYSDDVVATINQLTLPRYGLGNYLETNPEHPPTQHESSIIGDLSRAGQRLMGFCRTGLFKRLESCGYSFLQSVERHVLRNYVFLHALENDLPLPIGTQDVELLDTRRSDEDPDDPSLHLALDDDRHEVDVPDDDDPLALSIPDFRADAAAIYHAYTTQYHTRFKWLRAALFLPKLKENLQADCDLLIEVLRIGIPWDPKADPKLNALDKLLREVEGKVLVFTQFADTVEYLERELLERGFDSLEGVTGQSSNVTAAAWRFSPGSNDKRVSPEDELRILIATDVLSEGQNLQDSSTVVNFDLPWAVIRLAQRAGRVDRIGQKSETIFCYSFLPADGVERIIRLRGRVRQRLRENSEVVGTDEAFFEDDEDRPIIDLYNENEHVLDDEGDGEVDLASRALEIWNRAVEKDRSLAKTIPELPPVVFSARSHSPAPVRPPGVIVYMKTANGNDALTWMDETGETVTQSPLAILQTAECSPDTPPLHHAENHHELVGRAVRHVLEEMTTTVAGGQLGPRTGIRRRVYERLTRYAESVKGTLLESAELLKAIDDIYRFPLRHAGAETLSRQMRSGVGDEILVQIALTLREEDRLTVSHDDTDRAEPHIICSLGLRGDA